MDLQADQQLSHVVTLSCASSDCWHEGQAKVIGNQMDVTKLIIDHYFLIALLDIDSRQCLIDELYNKKLPIHKSQIGRSR